MQRVIVIAAIVTGVWGPARADAPTAPWSVGVTDAQKAEANRLLERGNARFLEKKFAEALALYREAVASWDHPAIRFNIVRCLIQLDRSAEAAENLQITLRYGNAPLEETVYTEALAYEKLLAKQVGDVTIECRQPGVEVSLDGARVVSCPGSQTRRLATGKHQLLGAGGGLLPRASEIVVIGGETQTVGVTLDAVPVGGGGVRPRTIGKILLSSGGGLLAGSAGIGLWAWRSYRRQFPNHCLDSTTGGAPLCDASGADHLNRARLVGDVATVMAGVGGVAVIAGALVLWRYPKEHRAVVTPASSGIGLAISGVF